MKSGSKLILYFVIAFLFSWLCWLPGVLQTAGVAIPAFLNILGNLAVFGPLVSVLILFAIEKKRIWPFMKSAWNWKFEKKWLIPVLGLAPVLTFLAFMIRNLVEGLPFELGLSLPMIPLVALIILFVGGPVEEFGWRGYALPKLLDKFHPLVATLILGLLHGLWHLPLHFTEGSVQAAMPFWEFAAVTMFGAVIYTWIYLNTKRNLTLMILFHWMGNVSAAVFVYWTTEFGRWLFFGLQLIPVVLASLILLKKTKSKKSVSVESE